MEIIKAPHQKVQSCCFGPQTIGINLVVQKKYIINYKIVSNRLEMKF